MNTTEMYTTIEAKLTEVIEDKVRQIAEEIMYRKLDLIIDETIAVIMDE